MLFQTLIRKIDEVFPQQEKREEEKPPVIIINNYHDKTVMRFSPKVALPVSPAKKKSLSFFEKERLKRRRKPRRWK